MGKERSDTPSLLELESRGGDIAESGFSFQEQVILSYLPIWLASDGFTVMVREAIGDVEAKFYAPGSGFVIDLVEAKNHTLAPAEFWDEIRRFQELDAGSSGTYRRFTIACTGISESLQPLLNALRRIRDSWDFYPPASGVQNNSFKDYLRIITKLRKTEHDARFLFDKVVIQPNFNAAHTPGEALFAQALIDHLSEYQDVPSRIVREIYANLDQLLRSRKNQPITRLELETAVRTKITSAHLHLPSLRPIVLTTLSQEAPCLDAPELQLDWRSFFGGEVRSYPPADVWNSQLVSELYAIRGWILKHRGNRRIRLEGNRRLSAALSLGFVFSAVAGFAIEINYRGKTWATDAYATAETPAYPLNFHRVEGHGEQLVVTIGILRNIVADVECSLEALHLTDSPMLHIIGSEPILSPQHANVATRTIKDTISAEVSRIGVRRIHLFFAGPSHTALFLGHRLNAIAPIQCYEFVAAGCYVPTCRLG